MLNLDLHLDEKKKIFPLRKRGNITFYLFIYKKKKEKRLRGSMFNDSSLCSIHDMKKDIIKFGPINLLLDLANKSLQKPPSLKSAKIY